LETNLIGKIAHFDSLGQPDGIIVAVWVDPIGVLQCGLRLVTGQHVVFPFLSIVLVP